MDLRLKNILTLVMIQASEASYLIVYIKEQLSKWKKEMLANIINASITKIQLFGKLFIFFLNYRFKN